MKINRDYSKIMRHGIAVDKRAYLQRKLSILPFSSIAIGLLIWAVLLIPSCAHAEIDESMVVNCIAGEESRDYQAQIGIAEAIRNRGTLEGVYGCHARHLQKEPEWVFKQAKQAWIVSEHSNLVKGADFWENIVDFKKPYWYNSVVKTCTIGKTTFFKKRNKNVR